MVTPKATYDDFVQAFDDDESAELSHLNLPNDPTIARDKIEQELSNAAEIWLGWFGFTDYNDSCAECIGSAKKCEINIARYNLDYLNPRDDVKDRYDQCYQESQDWKDFSLRKAKIEQGGGVIDSGVSGDYGAFSI